MNNITLVINSNAAPIKVGAVELRAPGIQGIPGYTPIKGTDYFDGAVGPKGADGYTPVKGTDYFDGADGYTPIKGTDYFDGAVGPKGADGYTPIKGTDYWTANDIVTIKSYVDDAILGGSW